MSSEGFSGFALHPALQAALRSLALVQPTPVQAAALPPLLAGRNVLMQARTGSGKTAAYALPLLQAWMDGPAGSPKPIEALVLVPTRELALQVTETLRELARLLPGLAKVSVAFGGVSINPQMMALRGGADILVATPGRLLDLVRQNALHLRSVKRLVLDEADRLLDLGFADELGELLALLPAARQTVLCSATFARPVQELAERLLPDAVEIRAAELRAALPEIRQRALCVSAPQRTALLKHLLQERSAAGGDARAMVFVATRYATEHVAEKLGRAGIVAAAFHGEMSQGARTEALEAFKRGAVQVLLATDMAARGLHIEGLPMVVNYDLPRAAEDHVHRIGRTGRAGAVGEAVSFITPESEAHFRLIEKRQGLRVPRETLPGFEASPSEIAQSALPDTGLDPNGGVKGKRPSKKDKLRAQGQR